MIASIQIGTFIILNGKNADLQTPNLTLPKYHSFNYKWLENLN